MQHATSAAVGDLLGGRTPPRAGDGLVGFARFFAKLTVAAMLPRRLHAVARVAVVCWCIAASVMSAGHGQFGGAILAACVGTDLLLTGHTRRRRQRDANALPVPQLAPATALHRHVGAVAAAPRNRNADTEHLKVARQYASERLGAAGWSVTTQDFTTPPALGVSDAGYPAANLWPLRVRGSVPGVNIAGSRTVPLQTLPGMKEAPPRTNKWRFPYEQHACKSRRC